jgi:ankyrin repeat protein
MGRRPSRKLRHPARRKSERSSGLDPSKEAVAKGKTMLPDDEELERLRAKRKPLDEELIAAARAGQTNDIWTALVAGARDVAKALEAALNANQTQAFIYLLDYLQGPQAPRGFDFDILEELAIQAIAQERLEILAPLLRTITSKLQPNRRHEAISKFSEIIVKKDGIKLIDFILNLNFIWLDYGNKENPFFTGNGFLRWAARLGQAELARQLLERELASSSLENCEKIKRDLINSAINGNQYEFIEEFTKNNKELGSLVINEALIRYRSKDEIREKIIESIKISEICLLKNETKFYRLENLALHGSLTGVQKFLDAGAPLCLVGEGKYKTVLCALMSAVKGGHPEIVHLLLERGADPNAPNDCSQTSRRTVVTPLIEAARRNHVEVVRLLLAAGAHADDKNSEALRRAAARGYEGVVKLLLEAGADPRARNSEPLRLAASQGTPNRKKGRFQTVRLLLDAGADIHADNDGALRGALARNRVEIVKLLIERGARGILLDRPSWMALQERHQVKGSS